jgi:hypothetical protein
VSPAGPRRGAAIENEDKLADETADGIVGIDGAVGIPISYLTWLTSRSLIAQIGLWYHSVKCLRLPLTSWGKNSVVGSGIHWF